MDEVLYREDHRATPAVTTIFIAAFVGAFGVLTALYVGNALQLWLYLVLVCGLAVTDLFVILVWMRGGVAVHRDEVRWWAGMLRWSMGYDTVGEVSVLERELSERERREVLAATGERGFIVRGRGAVEVERMEQGDMIILPAHDPQAMAEAILQAAKAHAERGPSDRA